MSEYYNAFISYGRADSKSFATKLCQKLTENGLKIWFDQNDIPLAVDFQNQIDDGITKADNFLFIIAPHAVNSPYCLKEIELAVKYNKRIIPLLHVEQITYEIWQQRNPQKTLEDWEIYQQQGKHSSFPNMHPEIGRINWVWFQENINDFDKSFADLIELFDKHQDYVKQHTNILLKALDWENNQKQTRYLLTGKERQKAEQWLKIRFTDEQPPCIPTDLHCEFICESQKNADNLMTQVFLSFAEADKNIMQQIRKSLIREGITVWSSHTDIKTGKDFQIEINQGIAGADNLIFLLSPEAIKSEYCQQELTYALSLNKRIIPLLISATDLTEIPTEISNLQFINFTTDSYQEAVDKIIKEIQIESIYYQRHKILLVKALKWLKQNRNPSILLRGYNLEQYQTWLELSGKRTANLPTDLQTEFIAESAKQPPNLVLDVFISYSRADSDFSRHLNDALQTQGKTTWFDQESIATGTDFQQEIYRGIEQSDNFLFIISPESVNSPYCADEVEYAKSLNKRFVTVLHRKVDTAKLHPELAKVQWLDFHRYGGDFYANFSELVRTLDTDREYVREHTQMSQKALEWEKGNKNVDLLFRGSECNRAYEWLQLAQKYNKQPAVTEEIKEFILKSKELLDKERKKKQWQRQRTIIGMAAFSLIISLLAVRSEMQRRKAVSSERKAEMRELQTRIVSGERTLDLQLEAVKLEQQANGSTAKIQTIDILQQTVDWQGYKEINSLEGHENDVWGVAISPKGDLIASASGDNTVKLWKADGTLVRTLTGHENSVYGVAFSPKGDLIASASRDNTVKLWKADGTLVRTLTGHKNTVIGVAFSPKGDLIASASADKTVKLWKPDGTLVRTLTGHENYVWGVAFSPKGDLIASASADKTVKLWKADGTLVRTLTGHESSVRGVAFSPKGDLIASASIDNTVKLWKADGTLVRTLTGHESSVRGVAFSPKGDLIASASSDNTVKLWKPDGTLVRTLTGHESYVWGVAFSPKGDLIASASDDNTVKLWRFNQDDLTAHACQWMSDYLKNNPNVTEEERRLCGVEPSATALFFQGEKLAAEGKVDSAISAFQKAVKLGSNFPFNVAIAKELAQEDKVKAAEKLLEAFIELDNNIDLLPETEVKDQNPGLVVRHFQAEGKVEEAVKLVKDRKIEEAINKFKSAQKLQSDIDLNSDTEEIETDAEVVAKKLAAPGKVEEGENLAKDGKVAEAISVFQEAQKLQSDIDLNSDTEEIETDAEAVAKKLAAPAKVRRGKTLAEQGEIDEAINLFEEAEKLDSELEITAHDWNQICWNGGLYNRAKDVIFACEKAVKLAPEDGGIIDSRGLARALTGDFAGAIKDFEVFIKWTDNAEEKTQRQGWVDALKKGENPFTEEVLEELR